jgi:hypothetical protein
MVEIPLLVAVPDEGVTEEPGVVIDEADVVGTTPLLEDADNDWVNEHGAFDGVVLPVLEATVDELLDDVVRPELEL